MRLINADELIRRIRETKPHPANPQYQGARFRQAEILDLIRKAPTFQDSKIDELYPYRGEIVEITLRDGTNIIGYLNHSMGSTYKLRDRKAKREYIFTQESVKDIKAIPND